MSNVHTDTFLNRLEFKSKNIFIQNPLLNFLDFKNNFLKVSKNLESYNLDKQSLVIVDIEDPQTFITVVFALLNQGLIPCLWNSYFTPQQKQDILNQNTYRAFISDKNKFENLTQLQLPEILKPSSLANFNLNLDAQIIFYTSGTTSAKACALTLKNLFYNAQGSLSMIPFESTDCWGLCLPHFHVGGFSIFIRAILSEASVDFLDLTQKNSYVTHISLVPTQLQRIHNQIILPKLKHCLIGGSAIAQSLLMETYQKLPLHLSYGMTEMGSQVATTSVLKTLDEPYIILPFRKIEIQEDCIAVGGECLFLGYMENNLLKTNAAFFRTQDVGALENGNLKIRGRKDRIFQSGGENISCDWIESEFLKLPEIKNIRIDKEVDLDYGYVPVAYIESNLPEDQLRIFAQNTLPGLMRPKKYYPFKSQTWKK